VSGLIEFEFERYRFLVHRGWSEECWCSAPWQTGETTVSTAVHERLNVSGRLLPKIKERRLDKITSAPLVYI
jgi:hypothetical protein